MASKLEKLRVSIGAREAAWARQQAESSGRTLSAILTEALRRQRQSEAQQRLLGMLGTDDITEADLEAIRSEWRQR